MTLTKAKECDLCKHSYGKMHKSDPRVKDCYPCECCVFCQRATIYRKLQSRWTQDSKVSLNEVAEATRCFVMGRPHDLLKDLIIE